MMSGFNRLLNRRDKSKHGRDKSKSRAQEIEEHPTSFLYGYFTSNEREALPEPDPSKVREIFDLMSRYNLRSLLQSDIKYALSLPATEGDLHKTLSFLRRLQDSIDLTIAPYDPMLRILGAINRSAVSCWLDATLFALFGCQDSYESMLTKSFEDVRKNRLATLLRLWVNTIRVGVLVTTDITEHILKALVDCGWSEIAENRQQDAGEAFGFITEELGLPNLYLKMDLFHHGKEDSADDHKIVQERLLEMPIPEPPEDGSVVTIEHCMEAALNAKVEVRRFMEDRARRRTLERSATVGALRSHGSQDSSKGQVVHIETVEIEGSVPSTPTPTHPHSPPPPYEPRTQSLTLLRTQSVLQNTPICDKAVEAGLDGISDTRSRAGSVRKEALIPAWQMYSLIPFHSDYEPSNDAQVERHLKTKQPSFGIRLKRYGMKNGKPCRNQTWVDIPVDMALPSFIRDNSAKQEFESGKFKLSLMSAVCHRGNSVDSGHYVSLARGFTDTGEDSWYLFDDIASPRVEAVSIEDALKMETPYLLFYQVRLIEEEFINRKGTSLGSSPSSIHTELTEDELAKSKRASRSSRRSEGKDSGVTVVSTDSSGVDRPHTASEVSETARPSLEDRASCESRRGRPSLSRGDQNSFNATGSSANSPTRQTLPTYHPHTPSNSLPVNNTVPITPTSSKTSRASKTTSKNPSPARESRLSISLGRLTNRMSNGNIIEGLNPTTMSNILVSGSTAMADVVVAASEQASGKTLKKEKYKKGGHARSHSGKLKKNDGPPDRECILM